MQTILLCEHKRRMLGNTIYSALEELAVSVRDAIDSDEVVYLDSLADSTYETHSPRILNTLLTKCKLCENAVVPEVDQQLFQ